MSATIALQQLDEGRSHSMPTSLIPSTEITVSHLEQKRFPFTQQDGSQLHRLTDRGAFADMQAAAEGIPMS
ncbi:hypothetical protein NQZ68_019106 [Dissostichus eleginoides]|nr:hypothetical protein NQZ68_019106 [Dissostichus eleginoides]